MSNPSLQFDHNAGRPGIHANAKHPRAALEGPLQYREVVMMSLPPGDFDANSLRRPVDHEGPASSIHACSSEGSLPTGFAVSLGQ
jgi:hypothetical protein